MYNSAKQTYFFTTVGYFPQNQSILDILSFICDIISMDPFFSSLGLGITLQPLSSALLSFSHFKLFLKQSLQQMEEMQLKSVHSTAAEYWEKWLYNCNFSLATLFSKMKMSK